MSNPSSTSSPAPASPAAHHNARWGLILFAIYVVLYGGFVALATIDYAVLKTRFGGVNIAIAYGFGLIFSAILLAVVYTFLCARHAD